MAEPSGKADASRARNLEDVKTRPVGFRGLREPPALPAPRERRDLACRESLLRRIRAEFHEMPDLRLTVTEGARLFGLTEDVCARILSALTGEGFLHNTPDGRYARATTSP